MTVLADAGYHLERARCNDSEGQAGVFANAEGGALEVAVGYDSGGVWFETDLKVDLRLASVEKVASLAVEPMAGIEPGCWPENDPGLSSLIQPGSGFTRTCVGTGAGMSCQSPLLRVHPHGEHGPFLPVEGSPPRVWGRG